jgi:hypothetical protein
MKGKCALLLSKEHELLLLLDTSFERPLYFTLRRMRLALLNTVDVLWFDLLLHELWIYE